MQPRRAPAAAQKLREALKLAEQLGGSTVALSGDDLVAAVLDYAGRNNLTQIVVGKSRRRRANPFRRDLISALLGETRGAAVHVITEAAEGAEPLMAPRPAARTIPWLGHLAALATVAVAGGVAHLVDQSVESANLAMVFMLSVLVTGLAFGL